MTGTTLKEPELEFGGGGRHIDIRFGLSLYGPLDVESDVAPKKIRVGVVGSVANVEAAIRWLEGCRTEIPAKVSRQPNLFTGFPGFNKESGFRAELVLDDSLCRSIPGDYFDELLAEDDHNRAVTGAVDLFLTEIQALLEDRPADVIVCAVPPQLVALLDPERRRHVSGPLYDFHDMLKARAMAVTEAPLQLVQPQTYDPKSRRRQKVRSTKVRTLQDPATCAWNFHTALYYKSKGRPWRLVRQSAKLDTCFVGISFYYTLDRSTVQTSMAQVFDERGDGIIVRGGPVQVSRDDRTPHLSEEATAKLLTNALEKYRSVHLNMPARLVIHKTSPFNAAELRGAQAVTRRNRIERLDALSIMSDTPFRMFRIGAYPPLRGTLLNIDEVQHLLYLRGSVDFFRTYPGMYIPRPLGFRCERTHETPTTLARELLALSKMNWNDTQFDGGAPITVTAARKVAGILKYVGDESPVAWRYSHYM